MVLQIPKDYILILSGVPCIGKTTTAYNIVKNLPEFRRVSELDIIRTIVRAVIKNFEHKEYIDKNIIEKHYLDLFDSVSENDFAKVKQQSKILLPYIQEIISRQQLRKIPTIIEGSSFIPSTCFYNNAPIEGFQNNVVFINLYISDINEHLRRRVNRCKEREYLLTKEEIKQEIIIIREKKNLEMHMETLALSEKNNKIYSVDISKMNEDEVLKNIVRIIRLSLVKH